MKLSVIVPVYNEKDTILEVIERVQGVSIDKEIIVVDDGSTDGTREILQQMQLPSPHSYPLRGEDTGGGDIKVILKEQNKGKGSAVREGLKHAKGDVVIIQDADLELIPEDVLTLYKEWTKDFPVVYGSRFLGKNSIPLYSRFANKLLTFLTNVLFFANLTDMETCYKLCSRDILFSLHLEANGFEIEPEITCKILKKGFKIKEMPVNYNPRKIGKKINWKDGVKAIFCLFKYRIEKCQ